jgi:glycosyltransferase involved in cell wall biosynthesis
MRVIQVTDYGSPHAGSFVPMLRATLDGVRALGWRGQVLLPPRARTRDWLPDFEAEYGDAVAFAPREGREGAYRWLTDVVDAEPGPTLLHAHWSVYDLVAAHLARRPDVKTIWHFHTVPAEDLRTRLRNRLRFGLASRHVERMLCVSPYLVDSLAARGAPRAKLEYFPNGVDVSRFPGPVGADERAAARAALGLDPYATVLLHIGRDWQLKGGDLFLDALAALPDAVGLLVRGGDVAAAEARSRGLSDRVKVLEGTSEVRRLHAASDLMLATSRGEGMPFAVLEALSSGLGVVATDIPGHKLPGGGPPGLRIVPLEPAAIAAEAKALLARPAVEAREQGDAGHAWVTDELGLTAWSARLMRLYREIAAGLGS